MAGNGPPSRALVESIDLYTTLRALAGLPAPKALKRTNLVPILQKPTESGKGFAFSEFPAPALREWAAKPLSPAMRETFFGPLITAAEAQLVREHGARYDRKSFEDHVTSYSVRTADFRYTRWIGRRDPGSVPIAEELYDHRLDSRETINIAGHREHAARMAELAQRVRQITPAETAR